MYIYTDMAITATKIDRHETQSGNNRNIPLSPISERQKPARPEKTQKKKNLEPELTRKIIMP